MSWLEIIQFLGATRSKRISAPSESGLISSIGLSVGGDGQGMNPAIEKLQNNRFVLLFANLVLLMTLAPLAQMAGLGTLPLLIMFALVLLFAVNAASDRKSHVIVAAVLAAPSIVLHWTGELTRFSEAKIFADVTSMTLLFFTTGVILARIVRVRESNFNVISGAAAVYLLFALSWAVSYELIEILAPGSFSNLSAGGTESLNQFLYYSLTTLTTLGYGDITPINPFARIWSTLEAVTGVLYVAVLVARLVSMYRA